MKVVRLVARLIREARRWRNRHSRPSLTGEVVQVPYWGGVRLPVRVRNTGQTAARDCRYCRRQRFTMDRGGSGGRITAVTWYATSSFDVPVDESGKELVAFATTDPCPRLILADIPEAPGWENRFEAALVCRDRFGTFYRFRFADGEDPRVETWTAGLLNGLFPQAAPEWTQWVQMPTHIENREWTARFA